METHVLDPEHEPVLGNRQPFITGKERLPEHDPEVGNLGKVVCKRGNGIYGLKLRLAIGNLDIEIEAGEVALISFGDVTPVQFYDAVDDVGKGHVQLKRQVASLWETMVYSAHYYSMSMPNA